MNHPNFITKALPALARVRNENSVRPIAISHSRNAVIRGLSSRKTKNVPPQKNKSQNFTA
jgi:hypothetical protein